jgi:hypothetical protein
MDWEHRRTSTNFKVCNQIHYTPLKQRATADALSTWSFTYSSFCSVITLPQIPPLHHHRSLTSPALLHKRHTTTTTT